MGVIAISGQVASGKTTVAKLLADKLSYRFVSIGELFRKVATERGLTLMQLHELAERDHSIDLHVDQVSIEEAKKGKVVIEGHLAAWIVKDYADVKVYLKADMMSRASRLARREGISINDAINEIKTREESNRRRYMTIYSINISDLSIFDLVIDTSLINISDVLDVVGSYVIKVLNAKGKL
ncbi:(d)CMP kinase [Caldivirga sp. UBA161]|uniref:(d)CMP kinase n=1 Tax=Caldivirga sp. UBA161 TaxID=1915569 RepID=UPI0025C312B3|nr:AAA family ATPase [Caldivirga sp. UBA161]